MCGTHLLFYFVAVSNPYSDSVRSVDDLRSDGGFDGSKQISFGDSVFCDLRELPIDMICMDLLTIDTIHDKDLEAWRFGDLPCICTSIEGDAVSRSMSIQIDASNGFFDAVWIVELKDSVRLHGRSHGVFARDLSPGVVLCVVRVQFFCLFLSFPTEFCIVNITMTDIISK
ncbi:hypothetical protein HYC85_005502 [Camellia sinensis]|uniref:Uncharacterized protein n=1 Tax=Camellia sinensis TaxID=4442 RepID=A0A7J7I0W4_CAMSI|nr:hypothetical protein HYC85_005502 [Camellia sinensis]